MKSSIHHRVEDLSDAYIPISNMYLSAITPSNAWELVTQQHTEAVPNQQELHTYHAGIVCHNIKDGKSRDRLTARQRQ